jgi:hypothetical protein
MHTWSSDWKRVIIIIIIICAAGERLSPSLLGVPARAWNQSCNGYIERMSAHASIPQCFKVEACVWECMINPTPKSGLQLCCIYWPSPGYKYSAD